MEPQVAQVAPVQREALALRLGQVAPIHGLAALRGGGQRPVEVVGVGEALGSLAEDAGVVPGDAEDDAVLDVDDGRQVGVDEVCRLVVVASQEGESGRTTRGIECDERRGEGRSASRPLRHLRRLRCSEDMGRVVIENIEPFFSDFSYDRSKR